MRHSIGRLGVALGLALLGGVGALWWLSREAPVAAERGADVLQGAADGTARDEPTAQLQRPAPAVMPAPLTPAADVAAGAGAGAARQRAGEKDDEEGPSLEFRVHVVDPFSRDVEGALIEVWPRERAVGAVTPTPWRTDAAGRAAFTAPAEAALAASKEGVGTSGVLVPQSARASADPWAFHNGEASGDAGEAGAGLPPGSVELMLHPQARLLGRVRHERGSPAHGSRLVLALHPEKGMTGKPRQPEDVRTDEEGRFEVRLDAPSSGSVRAERDEMRSRLAPVVLLPGDTVSVELDLGGDYRITGTLTGPAGEPLSPHLRVSANSSRPFGLVKGQVYGEGRYVILLDDAGSYTVSASAPGWMQVEVGRATVDEEHPHAVVDLALITAADITGVLRLASGEPIVKQQVTVRPEGDDLGTQWMLASAGGVARTDESGAFRLQNTDPSRTYTLDIGRNWQPSRLLHVRGGSRDVDFVVEPAPLADVVVRLTDEVTHAPIPHAVLQLLPVTALSEQHAAGGVYRFAGVKPHPEVYVGAKVDGYAMTIAGPFAVAPGMAPLDVTVGRPGGLSVLVLDAQGRPLPQATVSLAPVWINVSRMPTLKPVGLATSGADGVASFTGLDPATFWVSAFSEGKRVGPMSVVVPSTGLARLTLTVPASAAEGRLDLSLLAPPEGAVIGYRVRESEVVPADVRDATVRDFPADAAGHALAPLPAGIYRVTLVRNGRERDGTTVIVPPGQTVPARFDVY